MTDRELVRLVRHVWRRKEKQHGIPRVPELIRRLVRPEDYFMIGHDEDIARQDFESAVDEFIETKLPLVLEFVHERAAALDGATGPESAGPDGSKRVYKKPFERRLRILGFVAERVVAPLPLLEGEFDTGGQRISWQDLAAAWNSAFPHDLMTREALRVMYWRAKRERNVREEYVRRRIQDLADFFADFTSSKSRLAKSMLRPTLAKEIQVLRARVTLDDVRRLVEGRDAARK